MIEAATNTFYRRAHAAARRHLPTTPLVLSFMGPSPEVTGFVRKLVDEDEKNGVGGAMPIVVDHHYYLNWQLPEGCTAWDGSCPMSWAQVHMGLQPPSHRVTASIT